MRWRCRVRSVWDEEAGRGEVGGEAGSISFSAFCNAAATRGMASSLRRRVWCLPGQRQTGCA